MLPHLFSPLLAWGVPTGLDMTVLAVLLLVLFGARKLPAGRSPQPRPEPPANHGQGSPEDDPHAGMNFYLTIIFLLSIGFLVVSLAFQAKSEAESPGAAPASSSRSHPSHFIPARPLRGAP